MSIRKYSFHNSFKISKLRFIGGIVLGLFHAFFFYAFLYVFRESFRILSLTDKYDLWVLSDSEVKFYNLFFAFIAVIVAQSLCFIIWFDKPKTVFEMYTYKRKSIVNEQRTLNWSFLSWYSKLACIFGLLFGATFRGAFHEFSLFPDYRYLFILIIIVLFLESWKSIRSYFKKKSFRWMILSMLIVSSLSYGLSMVQFIDFKTINSNLLSKNIHTKYILEFVESEPHRRLKRLSLIETISLVLTKDSIHKTEPVVVINDGEIHFDSIPYFFNNWLGHYNRYDLPLVCLQIHKDIQMGDVDFFRLALANDGMYNIAYAVLPKQYKKVKNSRSRDHQLSYFHTKLPPYYASPYEFQHFYDNRNKNQNNIEITQNNEGKTFVNGQFIPSDMLKEKLKQLIQESNDYLISHYVNEKVTFEHYFHVLSSHRMAVYELRDKAAIQLYQKMFKFLTSKEQKLLRKQLPIRRFEIVPRMLEGIELKTIQ